MNTTREKVIGVLDNIILAVLAFYIFSLAMSNANFGIKISVTLINSLVLELLIIALVKAALMYKEKLIWFSIPVVAVFLFYYYAGNSVELGFIAAFTLALTNIRWKKIIKVAMLPVLVVWMTMTFASLCGAIQNIVSIGNGFHSSWGCVQQTFFATTFFYAIVLLWVLFDRVPDVLFLIPGMFSLYFSAYVAGGRTATTCTILYLVMVLYKVFEDRITSAKRAVWLLRISDAFIYASFPLLAGFTIIFTKLNDGKNILRDNSFSYILGNLGIFPLIIMGLVWVALCARVINSGNRRLALAMLLIVLDSAGEHHFYELNYNILLVMPFANLDTPMNNRTVSLSSWLENKEGRKFRSTQLISLLACGALLYIFLPVIFSYYRTIFNGYGYTDGIVVNRGWTVFLLSLVTIVCTAGFIWSFSKLIANDVLYNGIDNRYLELTLIFTAFVLGGVIVADSIVGRISIKLIDVLNADSQAVTLILENAEGRVYSDRYPESYVREFNGISRSFYDGEDIARLKNVTLIVDANVDQDIFLKAGFDYVRISGYSAVFTNDDGVIEALSGYSWE